MLLSACINALEITVENRLFVIEPELTALGLQSAVAVWKMLLSLLVVLVAQYIHVPKSLDSDGIMADLPHVLKEMSQNNNLVLFMMCMMVANALQANLGMTLVKYRNAVVKSTFTLMVIPFIWSY